MAIYLPQRWRSQLPTPDAGVDWSNPLTLGLRNLWNMAGRGVRDATGAANGTSIGGGGLLATTDGLGANFDSSGTTYINLARPNQFNLASGSRWSMMFRIRSLTDVAGAIFGYGDGTAANRVNLFVGNGVTGALTNELITFTRQLSSSPQPFLGFETSTRSLLFDGAIHSVMFTSNGSAVAIYLDGISMPITLGTTTPASVQNGRIDLGGVTATTATIGAVDVGSIGAKFNGQMTFGAFWAADVSRYALELHRNPWQLFRPANSPVFYSLPSAGAFTLALDAGSYSLTGQDPGLTSARSIALNAGAYSVTGNDVTLVYSAGTVAYSLTLDAGSYSLTGLDPTLASNRNLSLDAGSYNLTGYAITFSSALSFPLDTGVYTLSGQPVGLTWSGAPVVEVTDRIITLRSLTERWRM